MAVRQVQRAIEDYDEAIRLNPQYIEAYGNRGFAYLNLGQFEAAIGDYSEAIRLDPRYADAYAGRALSYTALGKDSEADEDVKRAEELGVDSTSLEGAIAELKTQPRENP